MRRFKVGFAGLLAGATLLALVPGVALARHAPTHRPHGHAGVVFGTVASTTTGSFSVTVPGSSSAVTVNTDRKTKFVADSPAAATTGFESSDAVLANGRYRNGVFTAHRVVYDTAAFPVPWARRAFAGKYSGDESGLQITTRKGVTLSFNVNADTKYDENGRSVSSPTYATGDRVRVRAQELTDGSWLARLVAVRTPKSGH